MHLSRNKPLFINHLRASCLVLLLALAGKNACSCESTDGPSGGPGDDPGEGEGEVLPPGNATPLTADRCRGDADCESDGEVCLGEQCQQDPCAAVDGDFCAAFNEGAEEGDDLAVCRARCVVPDDPCTGVSCEAGQTCVQGQCVAGCFQTSRCADVECDENEYCDPESGACLELIACEGLCPEGTVCALGCAVPTPESPCDVLTCPEGERCRVSGDEGICFVNPCDALTCDLSQGEVCFVDGDEADCVDSCDCNPTCPDGQECIAGSCRCLASCEGRNCGQGDGCGSPCPGACADETDECRPTNNGSLSCQCDAQCGTDSCGENDGCGGLCTNCSGTPGARCRSLGSAASLPNQVGPVRNGRVCCVPDCAGKQCGDDDGCGLTCDVDSSCPQGQTCRGNAASRSCQCQPQCGGKQCGDPNGCGGTCRVQTCEPGFTCDGPGNNRQCVCDNSCPAASTVACGSPNSCGGGSCNGTCPGDQSCVRVDGNWTCQSAGCPGGCGFFEECIDGSCEEWCPPSNQCVTSGECCSAGETCGPSGCSAIVV